MLEIHGCWCYNVAVNAFDVADIGCWCYNVDDAVDVTQICCRSFNVDAVYVAQTFCWSVNVDVMCYWWRNSGWCWWFKFSPC